MYEKEIKKKGRKSHNEKEVVKMSEKEVKKGISRREFIKGAVAGVGGVSLIGLGTKEAKAILPPEKWDEVADVVVVGHGGAGATAAITAHDGGTDVLILEKAPFGGGNSGCSAAGMALPNNIPDAIEYYRALSFGTVRDEDLIRTMAEAMHDLPKSLKEWGLEPKRRERRASGRGGGAFPTLPGSNCIDSWSAGRGIDVFKILARNVEQRKIKVFYETPAKKLIQDPATRGILGVLAESKGREKYFKANRGVILTTGGYENNFEMQGYYNFPGLRMYPWGTPYNTGDGIKMASEAGADMWHFVALELLGVAMKAPTDDVGVAIPFFGGGNSPPGSSIFVNKYGKRFINEAKRVVHRKEPLAYTYFDHERAEYPNMPSYCIFDESFRKNGPLYTFGQIRFGYVFVHKLDEWSKDNNAEIKKGWIKKADTIEELASQLGIGPTALKETVSRYNEHCKTGEDTEFNRPADHMSPIETPPFYSVELCLCLINTQGGPKHNNRAQVLDMEGKPIPHLYASGELGSFFGHLYQGGSNFPEALAFGRIAGENVAAEKPWE